jgi:predicted nuclease of predicted toxin-antitoxin system
MDFLCDVQISIKIAKSIEDLGYKCEHVNRILKKWNTTDEEIIEYVDKHHYILITKDQDFRSSFLVNSKPKKIIKIDLGNISNEMLLNILKGILPTVKDVNKKNEIFMIEVAETTSNIILKK